MAPCKTSPAPTPLQRSLRGGLTAAAWLQGLAEMVDAVPPGAARTRLADAHRRAGERLRQWIDDEELSGSETAEAFWRRLMQDEPPVATALAKAIAAADEVLAPGTLAGFFAA